MGNSKSKPVEHIPEVDVTTGMLQFYQKVKIMGSVILTSYMHNVLQSFQAGEMLMITMQTSFP